MGSDVARRAHWRAAAGGRNGAPLAATRRDQRERRAMSTKLNWREVSLKKALELMRKPETRLVKMFTKASPEGFAHYVLPGGYVSSATAEKIKQHPLVHASKDGLFPGLDQTWRLGDGCGSSAP